VLVPSVIKLIPNTKGGPINCIEYKEVSVNITISCLVLTAPTISEPDESLKPPAVLLVFGVHCAAFS